MAKKKPDEWKKDGAELKKKIVAAKKKPQNFGLVFAKEGMILEAHPTQSAAKQYKTAKADPNGTPKGIQGVLTVNGTELHFTYEGDETALPGGITTRFKQYLSMAKVKGYKAKFIPKDGADEGAGGAEQQVDAVEDDAALKAKLLKDIDSIEAVFEVNFEDMDEKDVKELQGALKTIRGAINSDDLTGAQNMMNKLQLLTGVGPDTPAEPGAVRLPNKKGAKLSPEELKKKKSELSKKFADLKPEIQRSVRIANPAHKSEMEKLIKNFGKKMKSGELDDSEAALEAFEKQIASFDQVRDEGRRKRETQFKDIAAQAQDLKARLEQIRAERSAG